MVFGCFAGAGAVFDGMAGLVVGALGCVDGCGDFTWTVTRVGNEFKVFCAQSLAVLLSTA